MAGKTGESGADCLSGAGTAAQVAGKKTAGDGAETRENSPFSSGEKRTETRQKVRPNGEIGTGKGQEGKVLSISVRPVEGPLRREDSSKARARIAALRPVERQVKQFLPTLINGIEVLALVDSGNLWRSVVSYDLFCQLGFSKKDLQPLRNPITLSTAKEGQELEILGEPKNFLHLQLGGGRTRFKIKPVVIQDLSMPLNLSASFLRRHSIDQLHSSNTIRVQGKTYPLVSQGELGCHELSVPLEGPVKVVNEVVVPPHSQRPVLVEVPDKRRFVGAIEGSLDFMGGTDLHPVRNGIFQFDQGRTLAVVLNTTAEEKRVPAQVLFGRYQAVNVEPEEAKYHPYRINALAPQNSVERNKVEQEPAPEKVQYRSFMEGPTNNQNKGRRISFLYHYYKCAKNPYLQDQKNLAAFLALLLRYWQVFSWDGSFGETHLLEHEIHTKPGPPITQKVRPINPHLEKSLRAQVDEWLKEEVVAPSSSPWNTALVPVAKKDGRTRWCLDFRALNERTLRDSYPIGNISANLSSLSGSSCFSTMDCVGAFHAVKLHKDSCAKTAFSTPFGHFEFKKLPFGLSNGPATYARMIQRALEGLPPSLVIPYLDDLLIHSKTPEEHIKGLEVVFQALQKGGLKLQPHKCQMLVSEAAYLGHLVSAQGIKPLPSHTKVIEEWPMPNTRSQVRAFIGKVSYYRKFIKDFSSLAKPLLDKLSTFELEGRPVGDKEEFPVSPEMEKSFRTLKAELLKAPILAYPDFNSPEPFIVDTDWSFSNAAIGGCISQKQGGKERVIAYMAKRLTGSQKNYPPTKGELLAILVCLKHFDYYLQHRKFVLRVDHSALVSIRTMDAPKGSVARWLDALANFEFDIVYRPGPKHGNADGLSRAEHLPEADGSTETDEKCFAVVPQGRPPPLWPATTPPTWFPSGLYLKREQESDEDLAQIRKWIRTGHVPGRQEARASSEELQLLIGLWGQLELSAHGILSLRVEKSREEIFRVPVIPSQMVPALIMRIHDELAHRGPEAMANFMRTRLFFPQMLTRIKEVVRNCNLCLIKTRPGGKGQKKVLVSHQRGHPNHTLSLDFVGPLPPSFPGGFQYLLTVKDTFTRWLEAYPCKRMTAETVIQKLTTDYFPRFGFCKMLHSDNGTGFVAGMTKRVAAYFGILMTQTPPYNPKSNPVERSHKDLEAALTALSHPNPGSWIKYLPNVLFTSRVVVHKSTGYSPFRLVFGRDPVCPLDVIFPLPGTTSASPDDYAAQVLERQQKAFRLARQHQDFEVRRRRQAYVGNLRCFQEGDKVWVYQPVSKRKWTKLSVWWTGPWEVSRVLNPLTYEIQFERNGRSSREIVAIDRLRPYHSQLVIPPPDQPEPLDHDPGVENCWVPSLPSLGMATRKESGQVRPGTPVGQAEDLAQEAEDLESESGEGITSTCTRPDYGTRGEGTSTGTRISPWGEGNAAKNMAGAPEDVAEEETDRTTNLDPSETDLEMEELVDLSRPGSPELPFVPDTSLNNSRSSSPEGLEDAGSTSREPRPRMMLHRLRDHMTSTHPVPPVDPDQPRQLRSHNVMP